MVIIKKKQYYDPKNGIDLAGHFDFVTGIASVNGLQYIRDRDKTGHVSAHLSQYFPQLLIGSQDIKIGAEIVTSAAYYTDGITGGASYYDMAGQPYMMETRDPVYSERNHNFYTTTLFVQDSWQLTKRLTLDLGLRFDSYRYNIPATDRGIVYKNNNLAPRLGFALDVLGDRKNVLKLHYGHYYDKLYQMLFYNADTRNSRYDYYFWTGSAYEYAYSSQTDSARYQIDSKIKQPYIREISVAFERELFRDASLNISCYFRKAMRFIGWINTGGNWIERTIINPGIDGITGTADDMGNLTVYERLNPGQDTLLLTNPRKSQSQSMVDDPKFTARGLEIVFTKRYSNRWQMIASYHYTQVKGNTNSTMTSLGENPNKFINSYGEQGYFYGQPPPV